MTEVTITGLTRVRNPKPNKGGLTILAYFDCEARGFAFNGCAFARTARNGLATWLPKLDNGQGPLRYAKVIDNQLQHAMTVAAQATYRALGGTDGEWIQSGQDRGEEDEGLHPYRGSDESGWPTHPLHPNYTPPEDGEGEDRDGLQIFLGSDKDD